MTHRMALIAVLLGIAALAGFACSLYVGPPDPYVPPPLVLQGTKPILDAGNADD